MIPDILTTSSDLSLSFLDSHVWTFRLPVKCPSTTFQFRQRFGFIPVSVSSVPALEKNPHRSTELLMSFPPVFRFPLSGVDTIFPDGFSNQPIFCHGSRRSSGLSGRMSFCRLLRPFALFSDCHPFRFAPVLFASAIVTVSLPLFSEFHFRFSWIHDRPLYISFHFLQHMGREHGVVVVSARGFDACFLQRPRDRR